MKPLLLAKPGSTATPSRPISESVQTGIVTSVVAVPAVHELERAALLGHEHAAPSGRNAIAVGLLKPDATTVSLKFCGRRAGVRGRRTATNASNAGSREDDACE